MVQVDLDALKVRFYNAGKTGYNLTQEDINIYTSLDQWQRQELLNAMQEGKEAVL
jgi:uncharacterized tellurite resistance protein B-like protein